MGGGRRQGLKDIKGEPSQVQKEKKDSEKGNLFLKLGGIKKLKRNGYVKTKQGRGRDRGSRLSGGVTGK